MQNKKKLLVVVSTIFCLASLVEVVYLQDDVDTEVEKILLEIPQNLSKNPKAPQLKPVKRDLTKKAPMMEFMRESVDDVAQGGAKSQVDLAMPEIEIAKAREQSQVKHVTSNGSVNKIEAHAFVVSSGVKSSDQVSSSNKSLDYEVENTTGKTIYIAGLSYIKKRPFSKWRWDKSPIYKLGANQTTIVNIDTIDDDEDRAGIFGYLGVFDNGKEAQDSTFESLEDKRKIDLDLLAQLKNKKVRIEIETYGIVGEFYDYDFVKLTGGEKTIPELDFTVENHTGKPIIATCFVYEKKAKGTWLARKTKESWGAEEEARDDMSPWRFDKTSVIKISPGGEGVIDVDTIVEPRDRIYVRGYLVIFDEDEQKLAEAVTYELLPKRLQKLDLGRLIDMKNNNIKIYTEKYGSSEFIDYTVQPIKSPDFSKVTKGIS